MVLKNNSWYDENRREIRQNKLVEVVEDRLTWERLEEAVLKEETYEKSLKIGKKEATMSSYRQSYFTSNLIFVV